MSKAEPGCGHCSCLLLTECFGLTPREGTEPRGSLHSPSGMGLCTLISFPCGARRDKRTMPIPGVSYLPQPQERLLQHPRSRESCCASPCPGSAAQHIHPASADAQGLLSIWEGSRQQGGCRQAGETRGGRSGRRVKVRERR